MDYTHYSKERDNKIKKLCEKTYYRMFITR